ncbi:effector protein Tle3 domain-containing protein, partial [Pantoea phytobeneficialis]
VIGSQQRMEYRLLRNKTDQEIEEMAKYGDPVKFSQHSAIVMDPIVQEKAVAYDLAIGNCMAFEDPEFWLRLRKLADWRHKYNPNEDTNRYYHTGKLNDKKTKEFMNKPDNTLPKGEFGVVNEFHPAVKIEPARPPEFHNKEIPLPQWDMPEPSSHKDLPATGHKMVF